MPTKVIVNAPCAAAESFLCKAVLSNGVHVVGATGILPATPQVTRLRLDFDAAEQIRTSGECRVQAARATNAPARLTAAVTLQPLRGVAEAPTILGEWNWAAVRPKKCRMHRCLTRGAGPATTKASVADLDAPLRVRSGPALRACRAC